MKMLQWLLVVSFCLAVLAGPVAAQEKGGTAAASFQKDKYPPPNTVIFSGAGLAAGLGMGLTIIGAGIGMSRIGAAALESMARQPEVAPRVQTAMIIIAAMLEGATLASVILCYLLGGLSTF
jgi:F-type H+-transporting ATPase subunit c